jgi:putative transcriptional regulator
MPQRDVRALRRRLGFSQRRFARLLRVNADTLRSWEIGRRRPGGAAATLLQVLAAEPEVVLRILLAGRPHLAPKVSP